MLAQLSRERCLEFFCVSGPSGRCPQSLLRRDDSSVYSPVSRAPLGWSVGSFCLTRQAGARYGYALLWVLLSTTAAGFVMQTLAVHVGIVAGRHLAALAGEEYPPALRATLFVAAQGSILAFDVAEVVGTAVALRMLTGLPLVGGMLVSAVDTAAILYLQRYGLRAVEWVMEGLMTLILVCVVGDAAAAGTDWAAAAWGTFVPTLPAADGVVAGLVG